MRCTARCCSWAKARATGGTVWERFAQGYPEHRRALLAATAHLELAMRSDVNLVSSQSAMSRGRDG
jgi:hypothetical protein